MAFLEARQRLYGLTLRSYEKVSYHKKFLEIYFRGSILWKICPLSNFFDPRVSMYMPKLHIWAKHQSKKSGLTCLESTTNAFQNGMTQPLSTNNHRGDTFLVHDLIGGPIKIIEIDFRGVYFMKIWINKLQIGAKAKNQKSGLTCLFCSSNAFQNGKTQPIWTNNYRGDTFLVHDLISHQTKAI